LSQISSTIAFEGATIAFDPHKEIEVGLFIGIETNEDDMSNGLPLFVVKMFKTS